MKTVFLAVYAAVAVAGCASMDMGGGGRKAIATLDPTTGNNTRGSVSFVQRGSDVRVSADITGLKPGSEQAFHVHEKGDCSSGDGMSAGGHFNPASKPHGPQGGEHHAGDMPNLRADANGNARASFDLKGVSVEAFEGKGLIVHRDPDDYTSQPAGNAGPRVACGVIRAA
jgi:Cu-Zn family superoxide dismutase